MKIKIWRYESFETHSLRSFEDDNIRLKRLLADKIIDKVVLKDLEGKVNKAGRALGFSMQGNLSLIYLITWGLRA